MTRKTDEQQLADDLAEANVTNPIVLYHYTEAKNLPSIRKRGLLPHVARGSPDVGKCVWFTTRGPGPGDPPTTDPLESPAVLIVMLDHSDPCFEYDPEEPYCPDYLAHWWIYRGTIPPSKIIFTDQFARDLEAEVKRLATR